MKGSLASGILAATTLYAQHVAASPLQASGPNRPHPHRTAVHRPSSGKALDSSGPQYYISWFFPPGPVTNFVSTMSVPDVSSDTTIGPRYVWPGLENAAGNFVFQDVLGDQQPPGRWTFATWYVGSDRSHEYDIHNVVPGDSATSTFQLKDANSVTWTEAFSIHGADGTSGRNNMPSFSSEGELNSALFAIELWENSQWDFGQVTWSNISITAETTDTEWCASPSFVTSPDIGSFQYSISTPQASVHSRLTTCTIDSIVFESPR